jgi:hypothetical protein
MSEQTKTRKSLFLKVERRELNAELLVGVVSTYLFSSIRNAGTSIQITATAASIAILIR